MQYYILFSLKQYQGCPFLVLAYTFLICSLMFYSLFSVRSTFVLIFLVCLFKHYQLSNRQEGILSVQGLTGRIIVLTKYCFNCFVFQSLQLFQFSHCSIFKPWKHVSKMWFNITIIIKHFVFSFSKCLHHLIEPKTGAFWFLGYNCYILCVVLGPHLF